MRSESRLATATNGSDRERLLSEVREPGSRGLLSQATITRGLDFWIPPGVSGGPLFFLSCGHSGLAPLRECRPRPRLEKLGLGLVRSASEPRSASGYEPG